MCGIFALLNNKYCPIEKIKKEFMKSQSRGPEYSDLVDIKIIQSYIGFHRLSINGFKDKTIFWAIKRNTQNKRNKKSYSTIENSF